MSNTKNPEIDKHGNKRWYDESGASHREDGPAVIYPTGAEYWYRHGNLHRKDGPAVIWPYESEAWWRHGNPYRPTETELARWELRKAMDAYEKQL